MKRKSFLHAIFAVAAIATGLNMGIPVPAFANHVERHDLSGGRQDSQESKELRNAVIECWKPGLTTPISIARNGIKRAAVGYLAFSHGCTMWRLVDSTNDDIPPGMGGVGGPGGCDPEQARAMGFKPELGDCNG
jgi:hypothetical protein